jgi:hypothetical protein
LQLDYGPSHKYKCKIKQGLQLFRAWRRLIKPIFFVHTVSLYLCMYLLHGVMSHYTVQYSRQSLNLEAGSKKLKNRYNYYIYLDLCDRYKKKKQNIIFCEYCQRRKIQQVLMTDLLLSGRLDRRVNHVPLAILRLFPEPVFWVFFNEEGMTPFRLRLS